ncbi:MFS transporter [Kitasatospora sp. NPDC094028]
MTVRRRRTGTARLLLVLFVTAAGDEIAAFVLTFKLADHGPLVVALLQIANLLPGVLLGAWVGARLVGRPPGRVLAAAALAQAAAAVGLVAAGAVGPTVALVVLLAVVGTVSATALTASLPVFHRGEPEQAYGLSQTMSSVAMLVGPMLGAALYTTVGAGPALAIDAASFLAVSAYGLAHWSTAAPAPEPGPEPVTPQVPAVRLSGPVLLIVAAVFLVIAATAGTDVAFVFLVREHVPHAAQAYGLATAAWAVGILAGGLVAARLGGTAAVARLSLAGLVIGLAYAGSGALPRLVTLVVLFVFGGLANAVFNASLRATIYRLAGPRQAPRAFGVFLSGVNAAIVVGIVTVTPFAQHASRAVYLVAGSVAVLSSLTLGLVGIVRPPADPTPRAQPDPFDLSLSEADA